MSSPTGGPNDGFPWQCCTGQSLEEYLHSERRFRDLSEAVLQSYRFEHALSGTFAEAEKIQ